MSHHLTFQFSPWATLGLSDIVRWHFRQKRQANISSESSYIKTTDLHYVWYRRELTLSKIHAVMCRYLERDDVISLGHVQTARQ